VRFHISKRGGAVRATEEFALFALFQLGTGVLATLGFFYEIRKEGISSRIEIFYKLAECFTLTKRKREVARGYHIDIGTSKASGLRVNRSTQLSCHDIEEASFLRISSTSYHGFFDRSLSFFEPFSARGESSVTSWYISSVP